MGEFCFAYTGCTEEKGYPDGRPPMRDDASKNATDVSEDDDAGGGECGEFKVVIVADDWPAEITWDVTNNTGGIVILGTNDNMTSGSAAEYTQCISKKECYQFTIHDAGGDGICCDHGEGSYEVYFDGKQLKSGGAYYDDETTEFGMCGESVAPAENDLTSPPSAAPESSKMDTKPVVSRPTSVGGISLGSVSGGGGSGESSSGSAGSNNSSAGSSNGSEGSSSGSDGSSSGSIYRCVQKDLLDRGYTVEEPLCSQFVDCYNGFIDMGDDWFCEDGEGCTESPGCGGPDKNGTGYEAEEHAQDVAAEQSVEEQSGKQEVQEQTGKQEVHEQALEIQGTVSPVSKTPSRPALRPTVTKPRPITSTTLTVTSNPTTASIPRTHAPIESTAAPIGSTSSPVATTLEPTASTPEPISSTPEPIASTPEPIVSTPGPIVTTPVPSSLSTEEPCTVSPSITPTTSMPTLGPCDGEPCNRDDYCRR